MKFFIGVLSEDLINLALNYGIPLTGSEDEQQYTIVGRLHSGECLYEFKSHQYEVIPEQSYYIADAQNYIHKLLPKPFKPQEDQKFWYISEGAIFTEKFQKESPNHQTLSKFGQCFKTEEDVLIWRNLMEKALND